MTSSLQLAQAERRARVAASEEEAIDELLDSIGLSEDAVLKLGIENVSPSDRQKLKGIIARLRKHPHPFTQCMKDLAKHQPTWSKDRRQRTCAVLKQLTGRRDSKKTKLAEEGACVLLSDGVATLLEHADLSKLEEKAA